MNTSETELLARLPRHFRGRWLQGYARGKLRSDPVYRASFARLGASALPLAFALVTDFFFGFTFGLAVGGAGAVGAAFGSALGAGAKVTRWPCREPKIFFSSPGDSAGAAPLVAGAPCATLAAQVVKMTAKVESVFLISWQGDCRVRRKLSSASSRKHRILDTAPARR